MTIENKNESQSGYQVIPFKTYLTNCTKYSFERFILPNEMGSMEPVNLSCQHLDLHQHFPKRNFSYVYIPINTSFLLENKFWDSNQNIKFLFDLIEILDFSRDKFEVFKKLYLSSGTFVLKFRNCLRNIGTHPLKDILLQELMLKTSQDLNLAALFYPNTHFRGL